MALGVGEVPDEHVGVLSRHGQRAPVAGEGDGPHVRTAEGRQRRHVATLGEAPDPHGPVLGGRGEQVGVRLVELDAEDGSIVPAELVVEPCLGHVPDLDHL